MSNTSNTSNTGNSISPATSDNANTAIPNAAQLANARLKQWHQQGEALLTIENLRSWMNAAGLVLFVPRPQIASPSPSLVEGVLGAPNASPTLDESADARSLLARLIADGLAVPLNLLGAVNGVVGETPDFVCSTAVFSYVFTLRGDKGWKQAPATTGAVKVSQLALATFEALTRRGPLTAYDLTTELGKEVTEAAVLRALGELWTHLRVLPLPQADGKPAVWELATARFNKQIKAGANAGQPSALSALISLYLGQAVVAAEEEIESFLSPLAPRSRIRDVIHALLAARQLETLAVEGRTVLHVAGELPAFLAPEPVVAENAVAVGANAAATGEESASEGEDGAARITKYVPKPRKVGTGYLAKAKPSQFGAKPGSGERTERPRFGAKAGFAGGAKPGFKPRTGPAPDRERRPFAKPAAGGFDRPWEEEKAKRLRAVAKPSEAPGDLPGTDAGEGSGAPRAPRVYKPRAEAGGERRGKPGFGAKPGFGSKPSFGRKPFGSKASYGDDSRPPRREFTPRTDGDAGDSRPPRKTFSKPGTFGRKREGFGGKPAFGSKPSFGDKPFQGRKPSFGGDSRPPRREFTPRPDGDKPRSARPKREDEGFAPRKTFGARPAGGAGRAGFSKDRGERPAGRSREGQDRFTSTESGKRVYRKFDAPRDRGERPARPYAGDRPARPFTDRPAREGASKFGGKPSGGFGDRKSAGRPAGKSGGFAKKTGGDFAPRKSAGKPGGGFGGKKTFGKAAGGFGEKSSSTFAKFADNKKPFGKRPPARKYKPKEDE